jgi:hypothetical protein
MPFGVFESGIETTALERSTWSLLIGASSFTATGNSTPEQGFAASNFLRTAMFNMRLTPETPGAPSST